MYSLQNLNKFYTNLLKDMKNYRILLKIFFIQAVGKELIINSYGRNKPQKKSSLQYGLMENGF